ncbi:DUF1566 domain-containing protein [bacterium]|nr:DUF1566 domain-containing protein [bacterium]
MKKIILLSVIFVICLALVSCGSGQRRKNVRSGDGFAWSNVAAEKMNWDLAKEYCEELNEDGISGWRLPKPQELKMIYSNNSHNCILDGNTDTFWTSEEINENRARSIEFSFARVEPQAKEKEFAVRCLRNDE